MRRILLLGLIALMMIVMVACKNETVTLHCDGENCENLVEVKVEKNNQPDEDWVVFCQECADNVLSD